MTTPRSVACKRRNCKHFVGPEGPPEMPTFVCQAFPTGVPESILNGQNLHTLPHPDDGGIQFEAQMENSE